MSLRIIGGRFRNHSLFSPKGDQTRPTSGLVRKAIFDICQGDIEGAFFLDLFAGSGAMGLEALSRGASHTTFVDASRLACQCINKNLKHLKLENEATVLCGSVLTLLNRLAPPNPFTLIYIDPPYDQGFLPEVLKKIDQASLLAPHSRIFAEESAISILEIENLQLNHLKMVQKRRYGNSTIAEFSNA